MARLLHSQGQLPDGYRLLLVEGHRPFALQDHYFSSYRGDLILISSEARHHRTVLSRALNEAELVNYPTEWWHWSFGDRYWAFTTNNPAALYGPVTI